MTKKGITVMLIFAFTLMANADQKSLNLSIKRERAQTEKSQSNRAPIRPPEVLIDDHTLTFENSCIGCTIAILQNDAVIYSAIVGESVELEGEVVLPDYLIGVYEFNFEMGSVTFVGEIEL